MFAPRTSTGPRMNLYSSVSSQVMSGSPSGATFAPVASRASQSKLVKSSNSCSVIQFWSLASVGLAVGVEFRIGSGVADSPSSVSPVPSSGAGVSVGPASADAGTGDTEDGESATPEPTLNSTPTASPTDAS